MAERTVQFRLPAPLAEVARACNEAMARDGWHVRANDGHLLEKALGAIAFGLYMLSGTPSGDALPDEASATDVEEADWTAWCEEPLRRMLTSGRARVTIGLYDDKDKGTWVMVAGAIVGGAVQGSSQDRHLEQRVSSLASAIQAAVA